VRFLAPVSCPLDAPCAPLLPLEHVRGAATGRALPGQDTARFEIAEILRCLPLADTGEFPLLAVRDPSGSLQEQHPLHLPLVQANRP